MVIDEQAIWIGILVDPAGKKEVRRKGGLTRRVQEPVKHET
jgi:hypothetical protein